MTAAAPQRPYSPERLAERWDCSAGKVRSMIRSGELVAFRLGKQYRISAAEVERIECLTIESGGTETDGSSSSMKTAEEFADRLALTTEAKQRPALVHFGRDDRRRHPNE